MKLSTKKTLISISCISGICATLYGIVNNNNLIFLFGLILVIVAYFFIRKELKVLSEDNPQKYR